MLWNNACNHVILCPSVTLKPKVPNKIRIIVEVRTIRVYADKFFKDFLLMISIITGKPIPPRKISVIVIILIGTLVANWIILLSPNKSKPALLKAEIAWNIETNIPWLQP